MRSLLKTKKDMKGITLIALVITIIVLLILAGVSIAMLTGENGILTQANEASNKTKEASAKEKVEVEVMGSYGEDGAIDLGLLEDNLNNIPGIEGVPSPITGLPITVTVDGYEITINGDGSVTIGDSETGGTELSDIKGKYFDKDTLLTIGGNKVLIPGGATVSGEDSECSSLGINSANKDNEGLVIYITNEEKDITDWEAAKTQYDQFVWVPVETAYVTVDEIGGDSIDNLKTYITNNNKYPMAIKVNETDYKGILYNFEGTTSLTITPYDYNTTSSCREPDVVSYDSSNGVSIETLKSEFNTMVEKVAINGGFWVGRYETSNMNSSSFTTKEGAVNIVKGTQEGINDVTWYKMYEGQKEYKQANIGSKSTTTSSMIWGSQWDQIMIWMKDVENTAKKSYYIINSLTMGNFGTSDDSTSGLADTGFYSVKNIYDLAGNVYDWTLEAINTNYRVKRRRQLQ